MQNNNLLTKFFIFLGSFFVFLLTDNGFAASDGGQKSALLNESMPLFDNAAVSLLFEEVAPVRYLSSCRLEGLAAGQNFKDYLFNRYRIQTTDPTRIDGNIEHVVRYYREQGLFRSVSASSESSTSLAFRIDGFQSTNPQTGTIERMPLSGFEGDRLYTISHFKNFMTRLSQSTDVQLGAQVLTLQTAAGGGLSAENSAGVRIKIVNSFPIQFESSQNVCRYNFNERVFDCGCPDVEEDHTAAPSQLIDSDKNLTNSSETTAATSFASDEISITAKTETYFKKSTTQSSSLPSSHKCKISVGEKLFLKKTPVKVADGHYLIELSQLKSGCGFNKGYVYSAHVTVNGFNTKSYVFPLPNGAYTSGWCVCRSIGTSPHVGQDIGIRGTNVSIAIAEGNVEDITFSSSCGYSVYLRDKGGALWRYLHMNKPEVAVGRSVKAGERMGKHSSYPLASCGTGPHLHLERHSSGIFSDSERIRTCDASGPKSCHFDPILPFRGSSAVAFSSSLPNTEKRFGLTGSSLDSSSCSRMQPEAIASDLDETISRTQTNVNGFLLTVDAANRFILKSPLTNLRNWRLLVRATENSDANKNEENFLLVASGNRLHNSNANILQDARFCLPPNTGEVYVFEYEQQDGSRARILGNLNRM